MILKLTNNKNTYSFEVEDLNNGEKLFYHFQIPTADIEDGNYKMVLLDGDEIITEEQVCIGAYNPQAIQYSRGENVYINAPFEANLEDVKEVEITAIETTVLPSEGYDGIKAVEVNAQPIYDEGYNVGNAEGIEVGKAEQKALLEPITITENGTYENENGYSTIEVNVPDVNGSYDEGYTDGYAEGEAKGVENAGEIIAQTAQVLNITKNGNYLTQYSEPNGEGNLIKTVNVNVIPKINVAEAGVKFGNSTFNEVPEWVDFSNVTDISDMFRSSQLNTLKDIDFSSVQNMNYAFYGCGGLTNLDYFTPSKSLLYMNNAFDSCHNLRIIPNLDLSSVLEANSLFESCGSIEEIGDINFENVTSLSAFLRNWGNDHPIRKIGAFNVPNLENINDFFYYSFDSVIRGNLTEMGGFIGLKCNWDGGCGLDSCPNLTYQSCINILNGLADVTELGGRTLKVHQNFLTTVGDEISIGTSKNWTITA